MTGVADDPDKTARYCGVIAAECDRMDGMIRQLLELSRLENAETPLNVSVFSVERLLEALDTRFERDVEQKQTTEFGGYAESMRKDITKAESRIKSLRQQVDMAKARDSVQKAQVSASIASGGANGKLETAVGTLNRLQAKQQQRAAELQAQDELAEASTGTDLERKLRDAGITPNEGSANAILERLKQKSAE